MSAHGPRRVARFASCAAAFGCAIGLAAQAADRKDWVAIPTSVPDIRFAVDVASIKREGSLVKFNERLVFERPEKIDEASGRVIKEKRVLRIMHCADRTQGVLVGSTYGDHGRLIERVIIDPDKVEMAPIPAGTVAERELELVCARK